MTSIFDSRHTSQEWHNLVNHARKKYRDLKQHQYGARDENILRGLIESIYLFDAGERADALFAKFERLLNGTRAPGT